MRPFLLIWRRELQAYFFSPLAYAVGIFFLLVMGYSFWLMVTLLAEGPAGVSAVSELFGSFLFWMPMLIVPPLLTMRLLAEESRSGTLESLMTTPVSEAAVILGKYAGALSFFVILWLPTLAYGLILDRCSAENVPLDWGPLLAAYCGTLLVGALYLAVGLFCSSLTSNQVVAAVAAFGLLTILFFSGFLGDVAPGGRLQALFDHVSSVKWMQDFSHGIVDTRPVVFHLSGAAFFLFSAARVLESRRWK